jgi:predicted N-acetyltransferase YhbS
MATAGKEELEEALQLQGRVFGLSADYFRTLAAKDPLFDRENVFVAKVDGKVVSHVQVFPKLVRLAGAQVWMGGIGGVATDPDYRGKGLASELLKMAIGSMKRRGMETSVLFTGIQDFYRRLGWEVASGINRYTLSVDKAPSEVPGYSTRPFSREDLGAVASIYEEQNANRSLSVIRSEEIWDLQLRHPQAPAPPEDLEGFTVAEREGDVVGYARMGSSPEEDCVILESGCRRDHERALEACVGRLSERAKSLGHGQLTTVVPEDHPLALVMRRVGASREYAHTSGMMFKVVDPLECLLRIEDGLSKRAMESHASRIKLELLVGDESMSIEVAPGCVRVGREHNLPERFKTTEIGFARMMSGFSLPSELVRSGEASCTAGASGPMDLLFPKQLSHMYSPDFF